MSATLAWWEKLPIILEPYPHIPEREILGAMPEELKPLWTEFIRGQGAVGMDDGDHGIYPWDFFRFLRIRNIR